MQIRIVLCDKKLPQLCESTHAPRPFSWLESYHHRRYHKSAACGVCLFEGHQWLPWINHVSSLAAVVWPCQHWYCMCSVRLRIPSHLVCFLLGDERAAAGEVSAVMVHALSLGSPKRPLSLVLNEHRPFESTCRVEYVSGSGTGGCRQRMPSSHDVTVHPETVQTEVVKPACDNT